jgi:hypothetical protein
MSEQAPVSSPLSSVPNSSAQTYLSTSSNIFDQLSAAASTSPKHDQHHPKSPIPQPPSTEHDVYAIPTSLSSHSPGNYAAETTLKRSYEDDNIEDEAPVPKKTTRKPPRKAKAPPKKRTTKQSAQNESAQDKSAPTNEDDTTTPPAAPPKRTPRAKPAPKEPAPPSRARSTRTRKAPERLEDSQAASTTTSTANKKSTSRVFDPTFITTNSTSRLVAADAYHLLLAPGAWTCLTAAEQHELVAMLPASAANTALLARIDAGETQDTRPPEFSLGNDCFRTDVAKFQADLGNGHLSKTWQAAAKQAVLERANGEYDEWKRDEAEAWWGQKANVN